MSDVDESAGLDRRTMIKGAAGLGAAAALANVLTTSHTASAAVHIGGALADIGDFEVLAVSWGASLAINDSRVANRGGGATSIQDISITKYTDGTSAAILDALLKGKVIPSGSITIVPSIPANPSITYLFENVLVAAYSSGGSNGENKFVENLSVNFTKLTYTIAGTSAVWP